MKTLYVDFTKLNVQSEAVVMARQADAHFQKTGKYLGPLHGLPVSIKDCFHMKGTDSTVGMSTKCGKHASTWKFHEQILLIFEENDFSHLMSNISVSKMSKILSMKFNYYEN